MNKDQLIVRLTAKLAQAEDKIERVQNIIDSPPMCSHQLGSMSDTQKLVEIDNIVNTTDLLWFQMGEIK